MTSRALAVVLLLWASACATDGGGRPATAHVSSEEPISDISNAVRAPSASAATDASIAFAEARAHYDKNQLDAAIAGFSAIALAAAPDQERCEVAANLALDAMHVRGDREAMERFAREWEQSACRRPPRRDPPEKLVARKDPALDALSFLDGCWTYWSVDWGFTLCWQREEGSWDGSVITDGAGAGAGKREHLGLQIIHDGNGLVLSAGATQWSLFRELQRAPVTVFDGGMSAAKPQQPELVIQYRLGELLISRGESNAYKLKRQR
jgi:hypothetical protein